MRPYSVPAIARRLSAELGSTGGGPIAKARHRLVVNFGGIEELLLGGDAQDRFCGRFSVHMRFQGEGRDDLFEDACEFSEFFRGERRSL